MYKKKFKSLPIHVLFLACTLFILNGCSNEDDTRPDTIATKAIGADGGNLKGSDGLVNLTIPSGAMPANTQVGIEVTQEVADKGVGKVYTFTPEGTEFAKPVSVALQYTDEDVKNISPSRLAIAYKKADNTWQVMPVLKSDPATKTITTETTHFSQWSLVDGFPVIETIDPKVTTDDFPTIITITGANFSAVASENSVTLNELVLTVSAATTTSLVVTLPAGGTSGQIKVVVNGNEVLSSDTFIVSKALPTITGFSPSSATEDFDTSITITGTHFSSVLSENSVTLNGVPLTVLSVSGTTALGVIIPAGSATGQIKVTVNGAEAVSADPFTVISTAPTITGFSPMSAKDNVVTNVTISGTNFSTTVSDNVVTLNGIPLTVFAVTSSPSGSTMMVGVPAGLTTGPIKVSVKNKIVISADHFTVISTVPVITSFSPLSATDEFFTTMTITGENFSPTPAQNQVTLNGISLTVTSASPTALVVTIPPGNSTGSIIVTVNVNVAVSKEVFTVISTAPLITGFTPASGTEDIDVSVTITGNNFSPIPGSNEVSINGNILTVTSATSTQLSVIIPGSVRTGPIQITVNGKSVTSDQNFVFLKPAPTIGSFTPTSGVADAPTTISISGTNFSAVLSENAITLNGVALELISASSTALVAVVPAGTTSGPIQVNVNGIVVTSSSDFIIN